MLDSVRSTFIMLGECVKMSLANIMGNRVRSFLTVLGILIGVAAVIALITERIDSQKPGFLTWEQCRALNKSGRVELGSHAHDSHSGEKPGILRRDGESKADYEARIFPDLETSVELIETNVGAEVTYFAHPHGQKDEWSEAFVKELFPVTTTSEVATANLANGIQDMPRYNISMSTPLSQYLD